MATQIINKIGIIGTGIMGAGIAQIAAQADLDVLLFDTRESAAQAAKDSITKTLNRLVEKGKFTAEAANKAVSHLWVVDKIDELADCDLVIEAIIEKLSIKQDLIKQLEKIVKDETIIASNTSSLSVSAIASVAKYPERIAGFHFFNPVPLMKVVEVIKGIATDDSVCDTLQSLAKRIGHTGVRAQDTPGFIVNHAGRAFGTEALKILGEGVATTGDIDRVLRDGAGFKMGPFELFDLTGLDVSHPVMESVYNQYYQEPRYRPHPLTLQMLVAGRLGRKTNQGFYRYDKGVMLNSARPQVVPTVANIPSIWLGTECDEDKQQLISLVKSLGGQIETDSIPSAQAICLLAPWGYDATTAASHFKVDPKRTVCIDLIGNLDKQRTLMITPVTCAEVRDAAHALFAKDAVDVTLINDSVGFILQRELAAIVNLATDIAQQQIASVEDIDLAVQLGLGYPNGPLAWGDKIGPKKILTILERINSITGDPRYRPSPWLRRRALLGISLCQKATVINH